MQIGDVTNYLESLAPLHLQESYDNSGLIVGEKSNEIKGVLVCLDCVEAVVEEAISKGCNLIVAHHPIVFSGIKKFNNANYVQRTVQKAIKNDIAIYAIHTNLDNVLNNGVNERIAKQLKLKNIRILRPKSGELLKLVTYAPVNVKEVILQALFKAGAGHIGNYSECSFSSTGEGTYKAGESANPTLGNVGERHTEKEVKIEVILHKNLKSKVLESLFMEHPYEEVAYEIYQTLNVNREIGSGLIGELAEEIDVKEFLKGLKKSMELDVIRYTKFDKKVRTVALCGGSGEFLLSDAISSRADVFITGDFKYHQFFDAEEKLMICDIGHYESEKYTIDLLNDLITEKFSKFAVLKTEVVTNPVKYFL